MIIKSLSRATKSFEALYNYLTRDKKSKLNSYNLYANPYNKKEVIQEFFQNAEYLKRARGKNYLYHEIISLNPNTLPLKEQIDILSDLVTKYISLRAENHLIFTALHTDKEHTHIHLMISANELLGEKRVRLSKKDFATIQKELEQYINTSYPQLGATKHYNKDLTAIKSKKELLKDTLEELFKNCSSRDNFISKCKQEGLSFYTRGKTVGVIYGNKKYRLKTLGLLDSYEKMLTKLENLEEELKNSDKKVDSNENETKINNRREQMRKAREEKYKKAREKF